MNEGPRRRPGPEPASGPRHLEHQGRPVLGAGDQAEAFRPGEMRHVDAGEGIVGEEAHDLTLGGALPSGVGPVPLNIVDGARVGPGAGFLLPAGARTTVIYNGLDFTPTTPRTRSSAMLAILNTGHVEERKNQRLFIALAKELLRRDFRDFRITLVGTGPDVQELQHIIDREGLSGYILLAGWSDDIPAFLAETDLYIHTSLLDTCPYSVVEAISAGVPALAFNVGGLPEMLPEDTLFAPNDHIAMVDYLLGHQQSLAAIGARQYERARHDFSRTVQVERLRSVYTSFNRKP